MVSPRSAATTAALASREARLILAVGLVVGVLALFADKAFTVDDPLFVWLGRHITQNPFDFYRFDVNWYGVVQPMYEVTKNPPLGGYFIAAVLSLTEGSERALHVAFLIPAGIVAATTFRLA